MADYKELLLRIMKMDVQHNLSKAGINVWAGIVRELHVFTCLLENNYNSNSHGPARAREILRFELECIRMSPGYYSGAGAALMLELYDSWESSLCHQYNIERWNLMSQAYSYVDTYADYLDRVAKDLKDMSPPVPSVDQRI
jgi:hypothetical protein